MDEKVKQLLDLVKENPDMELMFMTSYEVCGSDDHLYWKGNIEKIKKAVYWNYGETIKTGEEDIKEIIYENFSSDSELDSFGDKELEFLTDQEYELMKARGEVKEAIIVYLNL